MAANNETLQPVAELAALAHGRGALQLLCELQRDWARKETVGDFMRLFIETGGTAGLQFACDRAER